MDRPEHPPQFWRTHPNDSLVCPHRDLSVCPKCVEKYGDELAEVCGDYWWDPTGEIRKELQEA